VYNQDFLMVVNREHSSKLLRFGDRQTNGQTDGHHDRLTAPLCGGRLSITSFQVQVGELVYKDIKDLLRAQANSASYPQRDQK